MKIKSFLTVYNVTGVPVCREVLGKMVHLNGKTVERHARRVLDGACEILYESRCGSRRKGKHGLQIIVVADFISGLSAENELKCIKVRGSVEDMTI